MAFLTNIDLTRLAALVIDDLLRRLPSILIGLATAWAIIRRSENRIEDHIDKKVGDVQVLVDGRMTEFKELLVAKGKFEGFKEAIPLAREDRKEVLDALTSKPPGEKK